MMDGYYGRRADVAGRVVDGEAVLVRMSDGMLHVLNPSASRIWIMADGVRSGAELAEGRDPAAVAEFLKRMAELDLMERASSPRNAPEAFPQEVDVPFSEEPPRIRISEPVETLAGPSACMLGDFDCVPIQVG